MEKNHIQAVKERAGGGHEQLGGNRRANCEADSKGGLDNRLLLMTCLMDWSNVKGNYSKFYGKNNEGVIKIHFCNIHAEKMTKETSTTRDGKNGQNKIQHVKRSFKDAHNFAKSKTGAGILENNGEVTFQ